MSKQFSQFSLQTMINDRIAGLNPPEYLSYLDGYQVWFDGLVFSWQWVFPLQQIQLKAKYALSNITQFLLLNSKYVGK